MGEWQPITTDPDDPSRAYIPLPGGWEVQTKGAGSTFRLWDGNTQRRSALALDKYQHEAIEKMARDVNAAWQALTATPPPPAVDAKEIMDRAWSEFYGNNQTAEFWHAFSDGVEFALKANNSTTPPTPPPPAVDETQAPRSQSEADVLVDLLREAAEKPVSPPPAVDVGDEFRRLIDLQPRGMQARLENLAREVEARLTAERARAEKAEAALASAVEESRRNAFFRDMRERQLATSKKYWLRAAEKALAGDPRDLASRVALSKAPPVILEASDAALSTEGGNRG